MNALQIFFYQTVKDLETCDDNNFWWDLSKDFIFPFGLALLAACAAYFIFVVETKRDKANEEARKKEERADKLIFFSSILKSILLASEQQKNNIEQYVEEVTKDNVNFHLMVQVPLNDLLRVSETLHLEEYLLAYANYDPLNRTAAIKNFQNIIAGIDFLYFIFKSIPSQLEKAQKYDYERKISMQDIFAKAYDLIGPLLITFDRDDPEIAPKFSLIYGEFMKNYAGNNYDLTFYYKFFFVPFNDFCIEYLTLGMRANQSVFALANYTRNGKQLYEFIKSENNYIKEGFKTDLNSIIVALQELNDNSKDLIKI